MFPSRTPDLSRLNKTHKASIAGVAAAGVAALAFSLVPGNASAEQSLATTPVAWSTTTDSTQASAVRASIAQQHVTADKVAKVETAAKVKDAAKANSAAKVAAQEDAKAQAEAAAKVKAATKAKAQAELKAKAAAKAKAVAKAKTKAAKGHPKAKAAAKPVYANNLDGWIRESLAIMKAHGIPGSYDGLHRNIMRESSGNPNAINNWDINAQNGIPSKGLLQVIPPTFAAYHVAGTPNNIYHPVSNIVAAANYAADKYGSIDNVNSAY
ncbi:transglycosylase SLT domain-containing protein [Streptomyces sp. NPDC006923]|uniref:transglycosylase SLT domain-containing protein n=1 Tax=Streptomyces sp. NPDC006923 TaxID=3155355 RepID=UPI0033DB7562